MSFEAIDEAGDKRTADGQGSVSAVLAAKMAEAHVQESIELARGAVALGSDEIEMDAMSVDDEASRPATHETHQAKRAGGKREAARRERAAKREARARADRDALDAALDAKSDAKSERARDQRAKRDAKRDAKREGKREGKRDAKTDGKRGADDGKRDAIDDGELPANIANKTAATAGKLAVTSNVPAMIYVDGRATGMMTPKKFAVPAGPHKVTLLEPESKKAKTQDVEIAAGKTATVDKQF